MGSHRISKAKRNLMGVCMIKIEYPQNNLNEFCHRFKRRYLGEMLFDRMAMRLLEISGASANSQFFHI
jgi:hypothetical protein